LPDFRRQCLDTRLMTLILMVDEPQLDLDPKVYRYLNNVRSD
jgi:hypothetical protein